MQPLSRAVDPVLKSAVAVRDRREKKIDDSRRQPRFDLFAEDGRTSLSIDLHGHLAGILSLATKAKRPLNESGLEIGYMKLVAGIGFEPTTFRL